MSDPTMYANKAVTLLWDAYTNQIGNTALRELLALSDPYSQGSSTGQTLDVFVEPSTMVNTPEDQLKAFQRKVEALGMNWTRKVPARSMGLVYYVDALPVIPDYCDRELCKIQQMAPNIAINTPLMTTGDSDSDDAAQSKYQSYVPAISGYGNPSIDSMNVPRSRPANLMNSPYQKSMPPTRIGNAGQGLYNSYMGGVFASSTPATQEETAASAAATQARNHLIGFFDANPSLWAKSIVNAVVAAKQTPENAQIVVYANQYMKNFSGTLSRLGVDAGIDPNSLRRILSRNEYFWLILSMAGMSMKRLTDACRTYQQERPHIYDGVKNNTGNWETGRGYNNQDVDPISHQALTGALLCAYLANPPKMTKVLKRIMGTSMAKEFRTSSCLDNPKFTAAIVEIVETSLRYRQKVPGTMRDLAKAIYALEVRNV